jgi:predicted porin
MLSKRTALYGRYETNKDEANVRSITGYKAIAGSTNYQATAVGIRHTF